MSIPVSPVPREEPAGDGDRVRRRVTALAALVLFWALLLLALGGSPVVVLAPAVLAAVALGVVTLARAPWRTLARRSRRLVDLGRRAAAARRTSGAAAEQARRALRAAARQARTRAQRVPVRGAAGTAVEQTRARVEQLRRPAEPAPEDELQRARRLSRESAALREQGRHEEAIAAAEVAARLFASLGDRRREALALNRLALARAKAGHTAEAIPVLERAGVILGELGDAVTQGRVLANLAALHQTEGRRDVAVALWHDALSRFEPDTPEHERVAERLRLAS